ncbi:hypothetical protein N7454_005218 [Penicillium verhagenii]|nr:hypothetical protein N7454_005218 [Penicillium verhagenii]
MLLTSTSPRIPIDPQAQAHAHSSHPHTIHPAAILAVQTKNKKTKKNNPVLRFPSPPLAPPLQPRAPDHQHQHQQQQRTTQFPPTQHHGRAQEFHSPPNQPQRTPPTPDLSDHYAGAVQQVTDRRSGSITARHFSADAR